MRNLSPVTQLSPSPFVKANFMSKLVGWWLRHMLLKGRKGDLTLKDLYQVPPKEDATGCVDALEAAWTVERRKCHEVWEGKGTEKNEAKDTPSLLKIIFKLFWRPLSVYAAWIIVNECLLKTVQALALGYLIQFCNRREATDGDLTDKDENYGFYFGYSMASIIVGCSLLSSIIQHWVNFGTRRIGMRIVIGCTSLLYRKSLRLSHASRRRVDVAHLINLVTSDLNRVNPTLNYYPYLVVGPLQFLVTTVILRQYCGISCLLGLIMLLLYIPFQFGIARKLAEYRRWMAVKTDARIRVMKEIVMGVRLIKMYTWEVPFSIALAKARNEEIRRLQSTYNIRTVNMTTFYTLSKLIILLTLLAYVLLGNSLTAQVVFVTLALYNNVRTSITKFFPMAFETVAEFRVSLTRVQKFLLLEEKEPSRQDDDDDLLKPVPSLKIKGLEKTNGCKDVGDGLIRKAEKGTVCLKSVTATWNQQEGAKDVLHQIDLTAKRGDLVMILGEVASGKGSILQVILKELPISSGSVSVSGTLAYVAQDPWIFSGTLQDNILFGHDYQPGWYAKVQDACALTEDIRSLPHGDKSVVGDRGILLSGGQKARVGLARAIYSNRDVILLDDPLSAVDAKVGNVLFNRGIRGLLRDKTVVLVTHQIQFAKYADFILVLKEGRCVAQGSYEEVICQGVDFHQLEVCQGGSPEVDPSSIDPIDPPPTSPASPLSAGDEETLKEGSFVDIPLTDLSLRRKSKSNGGKAEAGRSESPPEKETAEFQTLGSISWLTLYKYLTAGNHPFTLFLMFLLFTLSQIFYTGLDYWLSLWVQTEQVDKFTEGSLSNVSERIPPTGNSILFHMNLNRDDYIWIYCGIMGGFFLVAILRTVHFFRATIASSVGLHDALYSGVIKAPMHFFETNSAGRILNRFSKDIGSVDTELPAVLADVLEMSLNILGSLIIIVVMSPLLCVPILLLALLFESVRRLYLRSSTSLKRLEAITLSPALTHVVGVWAGIPSIRAFSQEKTCTGIFEENLVVHSSPWFLFLAINRWFCTSLDFISVCFIACVTFLFLMQGHSGTSVGLAISSALSLTYLIQTATRQSAELENQMVSIERVLEYTQLKSEANAESSSDAAPPCNWPSKGGIRMQNVCLFYQNQAPVLQNLNFEIRPGEKVGIVGRTGAGKSSLISSLFRLTEPTGQIYIDDVQINADGVGLRDVRSKISIVPQDPILFSGSIRYNLDPNNEFPDDQIWAVLEQVALGGLFQSLDSLISDQGANLSVGQRQLVCIARALLGKNRILVMDEATANVDLKTDGLIQTTLAKHFQHHTILNVAHRLQTVMSCDRIMMLEKGQIIEFEDPYKLMQDERSFLYKLAMETGPDNFKDLLDQAETVYMQRQLMVDERFV